MATSTPHFPLLQNFISEINLHINQYGPNTQRPTLTITSIYEYLISIDAPKNFSSHNSGSHGSNHKSYLRNKAKYTNANKSITPNISALQQVEDLLHTEDIQYTSDSTNSDDISLSTDEDSNIPQKYEPFIAAFKRTSNIICDACGSKGHHASKCFK